MEVVKELAAIFTKLNKLRLTLINRELQSVNLTGPQLFILRELFLQGPRKLGDLAKAVELSGSTVSGIVDRLERDGLIIRERDEHDRRIVWVRTTELCHLMKKEKFEGINQELYEGLEDVFTEEQILIWKEMMEKLIQHLEKKLEGNK